MRQQINLEDTQDVRDALEKISIYLTFENNTQITWLNHEM
jgi:hypothetical protein